MLDYRLAGVIGVALTLVTVAASADTVYLKDGSQLKGSVETLSRHKLKVKTHFAGMLKIDRKKVAGISTNKPVPVKLHGGKRTATRLHYNAQTHVQHARRMGGGSASKKQKVQIAEITAIRPQAISKQKRMARAKKFTLPGYETNSSLSQVNWSGNGRFGLNGSTGNSKNMNITAAVSALRNTGLTRLHLLASVNRATTNGNQTEADYLGQATYERDISKHWYLFGEQSLERDKFQNYSLRSRSLVGPGYFVIRQRRLIFKLHTGLGYEYTKYYDTGKTNNALAASAGWHYAELFGNYLKLSDDFDIYPQLTNAPSRNFSLKNVFAASVPIANSSVWAISAQVENDYNNSPRKSSIDKLDTIYSLALQRSF